jgi:hypothetical protein
MLSPFNEDLFVFLETSLFFRLVMRFILLQGVLDVRKGRCRPVERGNIDLYRKQTADQIDVSSRESSLLPTLWMALLLVALRLPNSRPWNPDLKLKMASSGLPGALFSMHESVMEL